MFSPLTKQLIDALCGLPGVGPRSAQRITFYLLAKGHTKGLTLAEALTKALTQVTLCQICRNYTEHDICDLCRNPKRDRSLLCVVENPADLAAIEQTNSYRGHYFVLQGHLSPLDGIGPMEIGIPLLLEYLQKEPVQELIIATNPTMEGRATAHYIVAHIDHKKIKCSRIAHGVPIGGEIEYLDASTLAHAFQARVEIVES